MNICLLGLSGAGKTCYLYTMSHILSKGISVSGHTISAISMHRQQGLRLNRGIEQMANGEWPAGSTNTITYPFELKIDGRPIDTFSIYDYRGGTLDGTSDNDFVDSEELFDSFKDSSCIIFLIDGDTLLSALDPKDLEVEHGRNVTIQSQLNAHNKITYIESLFRECSQRLNKNVPILLTITKRDIFSDRELNAGQELLKRLLPTLFSKDNDMIVGVTSVTLGRSLRNDRGRLEGTLCLNTEGNIHLPVLFALLLELDENSTVWGNADERGRLIRSLFTSDRILFYRGGKPATIVG